jgi:hypothetical protein
MKPGLLFFGVVLMAAACKKKEALPEQQGVNFKLLLKTVTKENINNIQTTVVYSYNSSKELVQTKTATTGGAGAVRGSETETFYRNAAGRLDSTVTTLDNNGTPLFAGKLIFSYDGGNQLIRSMYFGSTNINDSSVYTYAGGALRQRVSYRSANGNPYTLQVTAGYNFDISGNYNSILFTWPVGPRTDTMRFTYDARINSIPIERYYPSYWTSLFYTDYQPPNNFTSINGPDASYQSAIQYTYTGNNKPLYRKRTMVNYSPQQVYETFYYYD